MSRVLVALVVVLFTSACQKDEKTAPSPGPTKSVPVVALSQQPWRNSAADGSVAMQPPPSAQVPQGDGREVAAGSRIGRDSAAGCSDEKCLLEKCGKLCVAWMDETYKAFKSTRQRNEVYFGCLGACLSAGREAGVKFPEKP